MIPDITYLILNYNPAGEIVAQDVLKATIDSFYERKSRNLSCEVFLLDQGTTELHRQWLVDQQRKYNFSSILMNENIGISGAINKIVRLSRSPVVALLTSDVIVTKGMDEDLFEKIQIPEVYQAVPFADKSDLDYQTWQPEEEFGADTIRLSALQNKGKTILGRVLGKESKRYLRCIASELNVMFWRREVFDTVGYFDERWMACYENIDFALRCFLAGGCTAISRDSFVWHYHKMTHKNKARDQIYQFEDWPQRLRDAWDKKWPHVRKYIDIYKPLGNKTVEDFSQLIETFQKNIFLPYEQKPPLP